MKRNALKVKYENRERNEPQERIQHDEYLADYLRDFSDLRKRFVIVNNHAETILVDSSLQVFTTNNLNRKFDFHPLSKFEIKTKNSPESSQLDFSGNMGISNMNIILKNPFVMDGCDYPIGFIGEVSFDGFDFNTVLLCDVSHRNNQFGKDVFGKLLEIVTKNWDEISSETEIRSYKPSQVSLGMDAEFELIKNRQTVRAGDYFPFAGEIGTDGHPATLELRPHYSNQSNQLLENLTQLMQKVYGDHFEIETNGDVEALGAHVHFGAQRNSIFINLLDCWVAKPLWHLNGKARTCYKHLSESRTTTCHHGFEYRSLPSGILKDKKLATIVLKMIEGLAKDFYINGKEISLHPCKEDYLLYLDKNEWKEWRSYKKDDDKRFKAESWGCKRKGELYQRNIPSNLELEIPIQVYLYKLRKERGDVFYLRPFNQTLVDYFFDSLKNEFRVENEVAEVMQSLPFNFYIIGLPYEIHSNPSVYNEWLSNFVTFLNSSTLEEIPEL